MRDRTPIDRSVFLRTALASVAGLAVGNASGSGDASAAMRVEAPSRSAVESRRNVLLAYFSRPGENYYYGGRIDLKIGNTEVSRG